MATPKIERITEKIYTADEFMALPKFINFSDRRRKTITVLSPNNESKTYSSGQSVPGGGILPGFHLPVVEIFDT